MAGWWGRLCDGGPTRDCPSCDRGHLHGLRSAVSILNNAIAASIFVLFGHHVVWAAAGLLAISTLVGGYLGATAARTLPAPVLRAIVVAVGATTWIVLLVRG